MRISELARRSEVPVATIKYYLREKLLPEGVLTSPTQAQYDDSHVARLRLIRALLGPGGLSIAGVRRTLRALDQPAESLHNLLGTAHEATAEAAAERDDLTRARELIDRLGWHIDDDSRAVQSLAEALDGIDAGGFQVPDGAVDVYAEAMRTVAENELSNTPEGPEEMIRYVVLGTVLVEPLLLALRRLAQQDASYDKFKKPS